ncbi:MAG: barstar family protein [Oscillospiraceae bacterium]|nr:barstar family protein [Oscillospiraceae bacterium]
MDTEIFLSRCFSPEELHEELAQKLGFPEYYGKNLDALYDCLSEMESLNADIYISDENISNSTIDSILDIFYKVSEENSRFSFSVHNEEFLNIVDENEHVTNHIKPRSLVHRDGDGHLTSHIWIIRRVDTSVYVLLQKRSDEKLLYPGLYDVSSAGHTSAGEETRYSAVRELSEELGINADPRNLEFIGMEKSEKVCDTREGKRIDKEFATIFVYNKPVDIKNIRLQKSEVSEVCWVDIDECIARIDDESFPNCLRIQELKKLRKKVL